MPRTRSKTIGAEKVKPSRKVGQGDNSIAKSPDTDRKGAHKTNTKRPTSKHSSASTKKAADKKMKDDLSDENDFDMQSSPPMKSKRATKPKKTVKGKPRSEVKEEPDVQAEKHSARSKRKKSAMDTEQDDHHPAKKQNVMVKMEEIEMQSVDSLGGSTDNKEEPNAKRKRKGTKTNEDVKCGPPVKRNSRRGKGDKDKGSKSGKDNTSPIRKENGKDGSNSTVNGNTVLEDKKPYVKMEVGPSGESKMEVDIDVTGDTNREVKVEAEKEEEDKDAGVEEMSSDSSSESEWEEVEDLPLDVVDPSSTADAAGPSGENQPKEPVEISIEVSEGNTWRSKKKQKHEEMWRRYLQWQVNKSNKELQEDLHKVNLLCLLANGLHRSNTCNDMELQCIALSLIPVSMMPRSIRKVDTSYLQRLVKWFASSFQIDAKLKESNSNSLKENLHHRLETRRTASGDELVYVCLLILRALGLDVRLVASIRPITIKPIKLTKANKRLSKAKVNKETPRSSKATKTTKKLQHSKNTPVCSKFFQSSQDTPSGSAKAQSNKSCKKNQHTSTKSTNTKVKSPQENTTTCRTDATPKQSATSGPRPKNRQRRKCASKVKPIVDLSGSESESSSEEYKAVDLDSDSDYEKSELRKSNSRKKQKRISHMKKTTLSDESDSECEKLDGVQKKHSTKGTKQLVTHSSEGIWETGHDAKSKVQGKKKVEKKRAGKSQHNCGGDTSVEELNSDSDFEVEVIKVAAGPRKSTSSSGEGSAKKKSKKVVSSDSEESVQIIKTKGNLDKQGTDNWLEVYCTSENAWICLDCIHGHVKRPELSESHASKPIIYIVAFDNDGSMKDITHRYDSNWMIGTQKLRVDSEWWQETLGPFRTKNTRRDRQEDDQLQGKLLDKPLPTTISEYKGHPLYALKRHLLKFEGLYPETASILGYCRGEAVYARECVHELHTRQTWLKEAKVVRIGEKPYKMVKARPKRNQPMETEPSLEVFGEWQTEDYIPPPAVDGVVPRNEHGNVELFKECMLPKGTVHMRLVGLNRIARKLEIDCAQAMTGWDFHSGFCHPVLDGYVVCEEYEDLLTDAWHKEQQEIEKKKRKKKEERALKNWKLLIKGVLIRERLNKRFQLDHGGASTSSPSKNKAKKSEKVAWPKNRLTAFEGDESNRLPFEKL